MTTRTAYLDYSVRGAEASAGKVRTLSEALARQKREAEASRSALMAAQGGMGFFGAVAQSAQAKVTGLSNSLGPLGAGLGAISRQGPQAAQGLIALVAQQERLGLLSRATNMAILGGASAMIASGVAAAAYTDNILRGADAYQAMTARLRIFSEGAIEAAQTERALYETGRETRQGVEQLTTLYTRLAPAVADAGRAQADALQITELTSKALMIQGASVREAEASTVQFAQSLASGVMRGDELRSLLEAAPQLLRYISQTIEINGKVGVGFGQMRALGEAGLLTTDRIMSALIAATPLIERDFINAPKTAQQGWIVLSDTITRAVGQISQATGLQQGVVGFLSTLAEKIDGFRQKALLDPDALNPVEDGIRLIGDALEGAAALAGGVVENFDLIVNAAEALIALKLGEVLTGWFTAAAAKARELVAFVKAGVATEQFRGSDGDNQTRMIAAQAARAAAEASEARRTDLIAQADHKAAMAAAARAAADRAVAEAAALKATAGANATRVAELEALASAQVANAERAETQARAAATAATNAGMAASVRMAVAKEAEALVVNQVTVAYALGAMAGRGLIAVYTALGGAIGLVTLALGGIIYAVVQARQAWHDKIEALRDAVVVSDELRAITDQLASATWAEIPALQAAAQAHRDKAAAAREDARATRDAAAARLAQVEGALDVAPPGARPALLGERARLREVIGDANGVIAAGNADAVTAPLETFRETWTVRYRDLQRREEENRTGRTLGGQQITPAQRADNTRVIRETRQQARQEQTRVAGASAGADYTASLHPASEAHGEVASALRRNLTLLDEIANGGGTNTRNTPVSSSSRRGGSSMSAEDRQILTQLERVADARALGDVMGRAAPGAGAFGLSDGRVTRDGQVFTARSEDEARAALAYKEQIEAINAASDDLIAKSGLSRAELAAQAAQTLETALATSQATEAQRRWDERMAEAQGLSNAQAEAEREVTEARRNGVSITEAAADAYVALAVAKDRARRAEEALNAVKPVVSNVTRRVLDDMGAMPEAWNRERGGMAFDLDAALRQWADARVEIERQALAEIQAENNRLLAIGKISAQDAAERIAATRVAIEAESAEQIAALWRKQREEDQEAWRQRFEERLEQERQLADSITGSLEDLVMGGDPADIGKRFASDLLRAIWEELIGNPLNLAIRNWLRDLAGGGSGGGAGGLFSGVVNFVGGLFAGGGSGGGVSAGSGFSLSAPSVTPLKMAAPISMASIKALPGPDLGQIAAADARYQADMTALAPKIDVSSLAALTRQAVNAGSGGPPVVVSIQADYSIHAPGADPAMLRRVADKQDELQRTEGERMAQLVPMIIRAMQ